MEQALYRKYRSKTLDEIVGQEHITRTLRNAIDRDAVSHAYLLTGPHGVGKTSIARILAHEINQLPYESEQVHLDIIEIDAASNRRIDEIRDLRDKVHTAPARVDLPPTFERKHYVNQCRRHSLYRAHSSLHLRALQINVIYLQASRIHTFHVVCELLLQVRLLLLLRTLFFQWRYVHSTPFVYRHL